MKTLRKKLNSISIIMSFLILFASCNQYDNSLTNEEQTSKFSGVDIFKGLFFFQNEIPNNISHLHEIYTKINFKKNDEIINSLKELSILTTNYISNKYPKHFSNLQKTMYSGNLFEIEKSLNKSIQMIEQAVLSSDKYSSAFLIGKKVGQNKKLMTKIMTLNLNTKEGVNELKILLSSSAEFQVDGQKIAIPIFFYAVAVAVSIAVAAYSVITKVAYWDPTKSGIDGLFSDEKTLIKEQMIANIGDYFSNQK